MSIDLDVQMTRPMPLKELMTKAAAVLAEMLGLHVVPQLSLSFLEGGELHPLPDDVLQEANDKLFIISILNEPEAVGVSVHNGSVTFTIGAQRTNLEFALAAALAIALGREFGTSIEDSWRFFGNKLESSPDEVLDGLKVFGHYDSYRKAADEFEGRLRGEI